MAKFSSEGTARGRQYVGGQSIGTTGRELTREGGDGWGLDDRTNLFMRAVTSLVEPTYYESDGGINVIRLLVGRLAKVDDGFVARLVPYLRNVANLRSVPVVIACEHAAAGGKQTRQVINSACQRADEPAEVLGYWLARHGRRIPAGLKRGIADAATRLYNERAVLRYDGQGRGVRMADVIELCHPKPRGEWQSDLFRWIIDRRHDRDDTGLANLPTAAADRTLRHKPEDTRREVLNHPALLDRAGWSWERLAGWLPGGMDAKAWEAVIPTMGYMALLRNLRNFEAAGVDEDVLAAVAERLADYDEVVKSRQFPYRFFTAYREVGTRWSWPLEQALTHSTMNLPELYGRTLVLADVSGSMYAPVSRRSSVRRSDVAALLAAVAAVRWGADLVAYASRSTRIPQLPFSIVRTVDTISRGIDGLGGGTDTWGALDHHYDGHDRVLVFTDEQTYANRPAHQEVASRLSRSGAHLHIWNLAGFGTSMIDPGAKRYLWGGFTDAHFKLMPLVEGGVPVELLND